MPVCELLYKRVGITTAIHALEFVVSYGILCEKLGYESSSMRVYAEFWRMSLAKAYREHDAFVAAFGPEADVAVIWRQLSPGVDERKDRRLAAVQSMSMVVA